MEKKLQDFVEKCGKIWQKVKEYTVWKYQQFSVTQILREINFIGNVKLQMMQF